MSGVNTQPLPFAVLVAANGKRTQVRLIGELDLVTVPDAEAAIVRAECGHPATLELDLSGLAFMDSTGLRLMLRTRQRALVEHRRLLLRRVPDAVQRVFDVTALASLFEFVN